MSCCSVLLLLACGSLLSSHPDFWTTSSTSSPQTGGRTSHLERSRLTGENKDQMALGGNDQPKGDTDGILVPTADSQDVTLHSLLPTNFCPFCSGRRILPKNVLIESLNALIGRAIVEQAVLQALRTGNKHQEDKKTSTKFISSLNPRI